MGTPRVVEIRWDFSTEVNALHNFAISVRDNQRREIDRGTKMKGLGRDSPYIRVNVKPC